MHLGRVISAVLLMGVGACAGPMGTLHSDQIVTPPVTAFDGSYRNTIRVAGAFGQAQTTAWCDTPGQPVVTVANGRLNYSVPHPNVPGEPVTVFTATLAKDGSFSGDQILGMMTGEVQGNRIIGRIDGSACLYEFSGMRV